MKCPLDLDTDLDATFHHGIEVDICPRCKGIWLDRGELDRLLAGATPAMPPPAPAPAAATSNSKPEKKKDGKKGKKKKSKGQLLADLLDDVLDL